MLDGRVVVPLSLLSTSTYLRWRDLSGNIESAKRAALKLHCLIQLPFLNSPVEEVDRLSFNSEQILTKEAISR